MKKLLPILLTSTYLTMPAFAQWQVPNKAIPVGRGAGITGFTSIAPGAVGKAIVSNGTDWIVSALPPIQSLVGGTGITVSGAGNVWTVGLSNQITPGSVGSASRVPVLTFNAQGQLIFAADVALSASPFVTPGDFSIVCDGVTDWHMELQSMLNSGNKEVFLPYAPDCLTNTSLSLPGNIRINGAGRELATIRGTGAAVPVFVATNKSNISFENFACKGSQQVVSWTTTKVGCLFATQSSTTTKNENYSFKNMKFSGFNVNYWFHFYAGAGATVKNFNNIEFSNNLFLTALGDSPNDPNPANNGSTAVVFQSGTLGGGQFQNIRVTDNQVDGFYICTGFILYGNIYQPIISRNVIKDVGGHINTLGSNHCINGDLTTFLSYAVAVYDINGDGNPPTSGLIQNNIWYSPFSAGLYMAGDGNLAHTAEFYNSWNFLVSGNLTTNQSDEQDATLPRASIVNNGPTNVTYEGNRSFGSFGGISVAGLISSGKLVIQNNDCNTGRASFGVVSCFRILSGQGDGVTNKIKIYLRNNTSYSGSGATVNLGSATGARFNTIEISGGTISGGLIGLSAVSQYVTTSFIIDGVKFSGVTDTWMANLGDNHGVPVTIKNSVFDAFESVNGSGLIAQSSTINIQDTKFLNRTSGGVHMLRLDGTCGTISGVQFSNVANGLQSFSSGLGTANPSTCTLNYGDQVQNFFPVELGSGGFGTANQKYIVDRWTHVSTTPSTTHLENRILTGN